MVKPTRFRTRRPPMTKVAFEIQDSDLALLDRYARRNMVTRACAIRDAVRALLSKTTFVKP